MQLGRSRDRKSSSFLGVNTNIVKLLTDYYEKSSVVWVERANFYSAEQEDSETVQEWSVRLKSLAKHCKFGTELDTKLTDIFIIRFNAGKIKRNLFSEKENITFLQAVEKARIEEASQRGIKKKQVEVRCKSNRSPKCIDFRGGRQHQQIADRLSISHGATKDAGAEGRSRAGRDHRMDERRDILVTRKFLQIDVIDVEGITQQLHVHTRNISATHGTSTSGKMFKFELDSGSAVSIMPRKTYYDCFADYLMSKPRISLINFAGNKITPIGKLNLMVNFHNKTNYLHFYVVDFDGPALLGRNF
ncbi:hypothetical protein NQ317_008175 [Molorchus minor]|uniref:Uncharacterized protein n=1 Tax=Molorchus minor TaxID=1323400 RepID=A0ABQ9J641_9CUCU|nr:hypothetical protein NQ317_008175 [Molorchus minor]